MNARDRFLAVMDGRPVDSIPFFEEEIREDVLAAWRKQGLPATVTADNYRSHFGLDRLEYISTRFSPPEGRMEGADALRRIIRHYQEHPVAFLSDAFWQEKASQYQGRDFPLGVQGWNGFQLPFFPSPPGKEHNEWDNLINLYLLLKDDPRSLASALAFMADYYTSIVGLAQRYLDIDFVNIREPIASATGLVISPADFCDLILPQYHRLVAAYRLRGIPKIIFSSISNVKALLPMVVGAGIDGLTITQIMNASVDYVQIGQQFPRLALLGGIESITFLRSSQAIEREVNRKAGPLLKRGRWLPALDDNARVNMTYRRYLTYRKALRQCCADAHDIPSTCSA
jgi:hypothetical protein